MKKSYKKLTLYALFGAVAGFAYYYFIGCNYGHCLISSNPFISTGYGAASGILLGWPTKSKKNQQS